MTLTSFLNVLVMSTFPFSDSNAPKNISHFKPQNVDANIFGEGLIVIFAEFVYLYFSDMFPAYVVLIIFRGDCSLSASSNTFRLRNFKFLQLY
jgi:hypothetical protein